jgi:hypothetical protein
MSDKVEKTLFSLGRRGFIASAVFSGALFSPLRTLQRAAQAQDQAKDISGETIVTDFSRSYCHCIPKPGSIWVRIQVECRCEIFDRTKGLSDEYILGVKAQTGLHRDPAVDPGYDFWVIFSKKYVYNKRVHTSSYNNNPNRVAVNDYGPIGWRLQPCAATPIRSAEEFDKALRGWLPITARTVFATADGSRGFAIEYPVKWADTNLKTAAFRVETGPVILLEMDRARVGNDLEFEDFQWAHLDYHSFDQVRCFLERPTPILENAAYQASSNTPSHNAPLTPRQLQDIEKRLFTGWKPPISMSALQKLFQTNHYSTVAHLPVKTTLYALNQSRPIPK